ncbi:hypothetical protein GC177_08755 [bacterium]|nr:hypothetical protein [bacterium]
MKTSLRLLSATAVAALAVAAAPAHAANQMVEKSLSSRPELSAFYMALKRTGVLNELNSNTPYTIFAPTNQAMEDLNVDKYACFNAGKCGAEIADILRNHIVPQEINFNSHSVGAVFSIDKTHLNIAEPSKGRYRVEGHKIVKTYQQFPGMLYEINGVIASPQEQVNLVRLEYIPVAEVQTEVVKQTTTKEHYYTPDGFPAGTTTKVTTTTQVQ